MISSTTLLMLVYVALAFLALIACLQRGRSALFKLFLIGSTSLLFYATFHAHRGLAGWPTDEPLPARFALLATVIEEPNRDKNFDGRLIVWVNAIESGKPVKNPRAYELPYQKDLHTLLNEAMKKNRQGVTQIGATEPNPGPTKGMSWLRGINNAAIKLKIADMPQAQLPEK